ncbi:ATP-binding cassette domain-containing protein [Kineosporia sp. A_224]|uniref:ATP-binding cassette domain-containing protein n=1 Tax=Kineosporia sp. A_224 TaxID=1962180 RepID=UPI000B4BF571|nr:ATP-binding cassette domain-containing protein [Kineosporia sp. A_224]
MTPADPPDRPPGPVLRAAQLVKVYPSATGETHALRGVDVGFAAGTLSVLMGPSGSGKSSLLSVLALQERPSAGEVWLRGEDVTTVRGARLRRLRAGTLAWVAQRPTHTLVPHLDADEQLRAVARRRRRAGLVTGPGSTPDALLDALGLTGRRRVRADRLSGGEQQRLAVATALVGGTRVVVADEPTAELDDASADAVLAVLRRHVDAGACVVLATHDPRVVDGADRVLRLRHGVLSSERDSEGLVTVPIDPTGRLQLPREALGLFPDGRAVVEIRDGAVVLRDAPAPEEP